MDNIIALDIGTAGTQATVVRQDGQVLARGYAEFPTISGGNFVEQDTDDWWRATCSALNHMWRILSSPAARQNVAAVTLSGQMQSVILLGPKGVLGRAILHQDNRAHQQASSLVRTIGYDRLVRITGNEQGPAGVLAKLLWLKQQESARLQASRKLLLGAHDYVTWRLCAATTTDYTTATTTGLLALEANTWAEGFLAELGLDPSLLPDLRVAGTVIGTVDQDASQATGIPIGTPVCQGLGDLGATTVGVGAGAAGSLYLSLDASGWLAASFDEATPDPHGGIFTLRHPDPSRFIQVAPLLAAGTNLMWLRNQLGLAPSGEAGQADTYTLLAERAATVPAGSRGLIYLPYLTGARAPYNDPHARACFIGLSAETTRSEMIRSTLEGTAMAYRTLRDTLGLTPPASVRLVGAGAAASLWTQILADMLASPVHIVAEPADVASRGAAIIAGQALGWFTDDALPSGFFPTYRRLKPNQRSSQLYDQIYPLYQELNLQLKGTFTAVASIKFPEK